MSTYLVVKYNNSNKSYTAKDNIPNKPYINISNKYFPLTTETSGTGIKVKINNNIYKIAENYTTTTSSTYEGSTNTTSRNTYAASYSITMKQLIYFGNGTFIFGIDAATVKNSLPAHNRNVNFSVSVNCNGYYISDKYTVNNNMVVVYLDMLSNNINTDKISYTFRFDVESSSFASSSYSKLALSTRGTLTTRANITTHYNSIANTSATVRYSITVNTTRSTKLTSTYITTSQ